MFSHDVIVILFAIMATTAAIEGLDGDQNQQKILSAPPPPVMGGQHHVDGSTSFTICAPFSSDDPGRFYYNNTKDGNSTSPWIPFGKLPSWAGNKYTSPRWWQTGLYYFDIKFSGGGHHVTVVSNEKAAVAHGPANCSEPKQIQ
jgi:hypothetical protein